MYAQKISGVYMRLQDPIPNLLSEDDIVLHELPGQRHGVADVHVVVPRPVDHLTANQSSVLRPAVDQSGRSITMSVLSRTCPMLLVTLAPV